MDLQNEDELFLYSVVHNMQITRHHPKSTRFKSYRSYRYVKSMYLVKYLTLTKENLQDLSDYCYIRHGMLINLYKTYEHKEPYLYEVVRYILEKLSI